MKTNWARSHVDPEETRRDRIAPIPDLEQTTDEFLMKAIVAGDSVAFIVLIERYQQDLHRFCMHFLRDPERAQDASQEVLLRLCCSSHTFDTSLCFKAWFLRIARNVCLTEIYRDRRVSVRSLQDTLQNPTESCDLAAESAFIDPATHLLQDERFQKLLEALHRLPTHSREILELRYFQRLSGREIAAIIGATEGSVRTRIHRALRRLRREMDDYMRDS